WVQLDSAGRGRLADSTSILPGTVTVADLSGRTVAYDPATGAVRVQMPAGRSAIAKDSIRLSYRILPFNLTRAVYRRSRKELDSLQFRDLFFTETFAPPREEIFRTPGLQKSGNLARGISFGNAQNVFVNSALNLQLEGKLADKLNLTASITDQNIPFQPEGNTQQLQQFDRIFITLENPDRWRITAGDVVLRNKPTNFLRFYKNIQGGALEVVSGRAGQSERDAGLRPERNAGRRPATSEASNPAEPPAEPDAKAASRLAGQRPALQGSTLLAAGIAKGKFASQQLEPLDNVQGPYRLRGPNGERFIIVLAGSERVFLDGVLLQRGFDLDYIIDYNQAEVTFSPRHLITRNSRLRVEFEYSDQNYARSIVHASHYQTAGRLTANVNIYREADNPDNAPNLDLRSPERAALQAAGDSARRAVVPGADSAAYARGTVQYERIDSTQIGETIYRYTRDSVRQLYTVRFSDVGAGFGDYEQLTGTTAVNGGAYGYVGRGRGRYLPLRVLPTPTLRQVATAGLNYQATKSTAVFAEVAASQLDRNLFSTVNDEDNQGTGLRVGYLVQDQALAGLGDWKLRSGVSYEFTDRQFSPIDRYRDVEFDRDWSTTTRAGTGVVGPGADDNLLNASAGLVRDADNQVSYRLSRRFRQGDIAGPQHWASAARALGPLRTHASLFVPSPDGPRPRSRWRRGEVGAEFGRPRARLIPGYAWRFDQNRVLGGGERDSVVASANYYDEHAVFLRSGAAPAADSARSLSYRLDYAYRRTFVPLGGEIRRRDRAQTWQGTLTARLSPSHDLALLATYRDVATLTGGGIRADSARESAVLAKLDHAVSLWQEHVRSELSYPVATDREPRRLFQFQETIPGQGTHYLPPGADPSDLNSYIEAQAQADPSQRRYLKVYLATDEYIVAYTNRFTWRLTTSAPRAWRDQTGWRSFVARFSAISFLSFDRRTVDPRLSERLNPFVGRTTDDRLLGLNQVVRGTAFFNRASPKFGAEFSAQQTQQKTLLTGGSDLRALTSQSLTIRRSLSTIFTSKLDLMRTTRRSVSTALLTRNFRVELLEVAPEVAWQPNQTFRLSTTYRYSRKRDTAPAIPESPSFGTFHETGIESRLAQASKRTVTGAVRFTKITFSGQENTPVGFEILNALRPGNNLTWQTTIEQRLASGLNLSLTYDGRKPSDTRAIHTGRMQVSVLF
ncbi:MAG: hypothetical protein H7330_05495, partial [Hymenobacteraceae bacterium]|nr:hypothetical protein [Hymenobacteraceae bacterium]